MNKSSMKVSSPTERETGGIVNSGTGGETDSSRQFDFKAHCLLIPSTVMAAPAPTVWFKHDDHHGFLRDGELYCQITPQSRSAKSRTKHILVKHTFGTLSSTSRCVAARDGP